jgi:hypothetical protein
MKIHRDLYCHFAFHRGIGVRRLKLRLDCLLARVGRLTFRGGRRADDYPWTSSSTRRKFS